MSRDKSHQRERRREEQRRYRERKQQCGGAAPAPWDLDVINFLIETHWLEPDLADDRREIGKAYFAALKDAARRFFRS